MTKDEAFFYKHAGWSYPQGADLAGQQLARLENAQRLAKAYREADEKGITFIWTRDTCDSSEFSDEDPPYQLWMCEAVVRHGLNCDVYAQLGGIDFGRGNGPFNGIPYAKVVKAELAVEALEILEREEK